MRKSTHSPVVCFAAAVMLLAATTVQAQTDRSAGVDLTLQIGFGGDLDQSTSPQAGAVAIALGYRLKGWSLLAQGELLGLTQTCADGITDGCRYPSAGLVGLTAGVRRSFPVSRRIIPYLGAAGGLYLWTGGSSQPGASIDLGVAIPTHTRVSLELGARWRTIRRDPSLSLLTGQFATRIAF